VGILSGLIQNIGATALFLPGILTISRREKTPTSALVMPIGFAAIVGGTLSMVGSGPLILINDRRSHLAGIFYRRYRYGTDPVTNHPGSLSSHRMEGCFLLVGFIPLGVAMQKTGTAAFLAEKVMSLVQGGHPALILLSVAVLFTLFSLFMSNVGAIVVLAPLVMSMAQISGLDPRSLALMAAVCAANSFILPTHQVNAFLMSSGGYRNADYLKAGGGMTLQFLVVVVPVFYCVYL
jgi:di/tricarboxylate transporter